MAEIATRRISRFASFRAGASEVGRLVLAFIAMALVLLALLGGALFIFTNTEWGRERVRRFALSQLRGIVHGRVQMGEVDGNLLHGATIHGFAITDSAGRPFVAVDSLRTRYAITDFLRKRIFLNDVWLYRPVVVLEKVHGEPWNWERIFHRTRPATPDTVPGFGSWIRLTNTHVLDGYLRMNSPWHPDTSESLAEQKASIKEGLEGGKRLVIVPAPHGTYWKVIEVKDIYSIIPLARLADPAYDFRRVDVGTLQALALPFQPPPAHVTDTQGTFLFTGDSVWWNDARVRLPDSRLRGSGRYGFSSGDLVIRAHGEPAAFADMRWAYPRFPSEGLARTVDFQIHLTDSTQTYIARNMDARSGGSHVTGDLGMTFTDVGPTDTLSLFDTHLRFANLDTKLLEQLMEGFQSPRRGFLTGKASLAGGKHALRLSDADVAFRDPQLGTSRATGGGIVGIYAKDLRARDLKLNLQPLQVPFLLAIAHSKNKPPYDLPIAGTITGPVTINGSTSDGGTVVMDIVHRDRGAVSALTGKATALFPNGNGSPRFDIDVNTHPLALAEAGRFVPSLALHGDVSGPVKVRGTLGDLHLATTLRLPQGGLLVANGSLDLNGKPIGYDLDVRSRDVNLASVMEGKPSTSLTLVASAHGRGTTPATLRGTFVANVAASRVDTFAVDSAALRVRVANGVAHVERATVDAVGATADVQGSFGLTAAHSGTLTYTVAVGDLGTLAPFVPGTQMTDSSLIRPRPGVLAARLRHAREDSARIARATEIERLLTGKAQPPMVVDTPRVVRANTLAGSLYAAGRISGNLQNFDLRGRAAGEHVMFHGVGAGKFRTEYAWENARTPRSKLVVGLDADTVQAAGFFFDTANVRLAYDAPNGHAELLLRQGPKNDYFARGDFTLHPDRNELRLADLTMRFDTTRWALAQPALVRWGGSGIVLDHFDLRNGSGGRLYANGLLPTKGEANLEVAVDAFPIENAVAAAQSDLDVSGLLTARGILTGSLAAPRFSGAFGLLKGHYSTTPIPQLRGTFAYADDALRSRLLVMRDTGEVVVATADGVLPVNLAITGVTGDRLLPGDVRLDVVADSLPLDLASRFTDQVYDVHGSAAGAVAVRGPLKNPRITGAVAVRDASLRITEGGARLDGIDGVVHMAGDSVTIDSLVAHAGEGTIELHGGLGVATLTEPSFDLHLVAKNAEVLDGDMGRLWADAGVALTGPFRRAYLAGQVTVLHGVIYIPASDNRQAISAGDPALFAVLDTTVAANRLLLPAKSPLIQNLRMDVDVQVNRNTWVRNKDANVEIFSDGLLHAHMEADRLALTGTVATERGEYSLFGKRFEVRRGSALFIGAPELNPILQATAEYQAHPPTREALTIRILIGGTLKAPRISLESDAQPPIPQTDLLSYLAFGKETASLLQVEGTSLSQGSTGLAGIGKQAGVRLATVALGAAVDEAEGNIGRQLGVDVFHITPQDVPQEFGANGFQSFLLGTSVEAGKYINPRTFVAIQGSLAGLQAPGTNPSAASPRVPPGARIEYRGSEGWRFQAGIEPRFRLHEPTLGQQRIAPTSVISGSVIREWRF